MTARLRMRPIGMDVLQDLVDSGDLDPAIVAQMPTLTFGAQIEWTPERRTDEDRLRQTEVGLRHVSLPAGPELAVLPLSGLPERMTYRASPRSVAISP